MTSPSPQAIVKGLAFFEQAQDLHRQRCYAEAVAAYNRALALLPDHPQVIAAFAQLAEDVQDWKNAEVLYRRLAVLRPQANVEPRLAQALTRLGRHREATALLETCVARAGNDAGLLHALACSLAELGRWEESLAWAERAVAIRDDAGFVAAILVALYQLGRIDELDRRAIAALARFPGNTAIRSIYAMHKLRAGNDYARAFTMLADMRSTSTGARALYDTDAAGKLWDGQRFDGTLRVVADSGLGEQLLGASMFAELAAIGQRTQVLCDERLLPLFRRSFPSLTFLPRNAAGEAATLASFNAAADRRINALDLGQFFRRQPGDFPAAHTWLRPDPERLAAIRADYDARWPGRQRIGISWSSSRLMEGGASKGIRLTDLAPILAMPGCAFVNLQYGDITADLAELKATTGLDLYVDPGIDTTNDLDAFAAQVAALDRVITTSNTTAHFAGALGVPCQVLLPRVRPVLWYWGYRGETTPWYPRTRLCRNGVDDSWDALVADTARRG